MVGSCNYVNPKRIKVTYAATGTSKFHNVIVLSPEHEP